MKMLQELSKSRIYLTVCTLTLALACLLQACKKDDTSAIDELSESNSCFISALQLGTLTRTVTKKLSDGRDSTYSIKFNGTTTRMRIDHLAGTITNTDSLPVGTSLRAVLVSVSFDGVLVHAPAADTTVWTAFSSADSLNLSRPYIFRVFTRNMKDYRDYKLTLQVHQQDPEAYTWQQMPAANDLADCQQIKAAPLGDGLVVVGKQTDGTIFALTPTEASTNLTWQKTLCTGAAQAEVSSLQSFDNALWMSTTDGRLLRSTDGAAWTEHMLPTGGQHLFAASEHALYAFAPGTPITLFTMSNGQDWEAQHLEDNSLLTSIAATAFLNQSNGHTRLIMLGNTAESTGLHVWSLLENVDKEWTHFTNAMENPYVLPDLQEAVLTAYDHKLFAIGKLVHEGSTALTASISPDNGLTWKENDQFTLPASLTPTTQCLTATVLGEHIWLFAGSDVWRVRFNGYGQ